MKADVYGQKCHVDRIRAMPKRYVFVDTETTGLSKQDKIVEIAALEFDENFVLLRMFHEYVDPGIPVGTSTRFHGLTDEFLIGRKKFDAIAEDFVELIAGATVLAHSMSFDSKFIDRELFASGFEPMSSYADSLVCTLKLAQRTYYGRASLDNLAIRFGIDTSARKEHHGALIDTEILSQVYLHLIGKPELADDLDFVLVNIYDKKYQQLVDKDSEKYNFGLTFKVCGNKSKLPSDAMFAKLKGSAQQKGTAARHSATAPQAQHTERQTQSSYIPENERPKLSWDNIMLYIALSPFIVLCSPLFLPVVWHNNFKNKKPLNEFSWAIIIGFIVLVILVCDQWR